MADPRRFTGLNYGHAGRLTYVPRANPAEGPGFLHTNRLTSSAPHFQLVGLVAELYPASMSTTPGATSQLWEERRTQSRWLLKSHPEAFIGNSSYEDVLNEDMSRFKNAESSTSPKSLLAVGQMTDVTNHSRPKGAQVLAAATGESGQLLRLVHMEDSQWQWGDYKKALLNLSVIDTRDREDEVIWESDGLPISQIKFATSLSSNGPIRWLIVQKQTSTAILCPEYHGVPVAGEKPGEWPRQHRPSRINPNPMLFISHQQTGGNAHCDVSFSSPSQGRGPQIAIVDECGYWTIWDIQGTMQMGKNTLRVSLCRTGHILEGLLSKVPNKTLYSAEPHGILFVGNSSQSGQPSTKTEDDLESSRSAGRHLLVWNHEQFRALDLELNMLLPKLPSFLTRRGFSDWILDVQPSPVNEDHIIILTKENVFWVSLKNTDGRPRMLAKPSILINCSHLRGGDRDMRMAISQADKYDTETLLVLVYSPKSTQLTVYWFRTTFGIVLPQWHRHVTELPMGGIDSSHLAIQTLTFQPAQLDVASSPTSTDPGSVFWRQGTKFLQGKILTQDLGVRYCICSTFKPPAAEVTLPSKRIKRSKYDQAQGWRRKRKRFLKQMSEAFALPDGYIGVEIENLVQPKLTTAFAQRPSGNRRLRSRGPVVVNFDRLCATLQGHLERDMDVGGVGLPKSLINAIRETIRYGTETGRMHLLTWREITSATNETPDFEEPDIDSNELLQNLQDESDQSVAIVKLGRHIVDGPEILLTRLHDINHYYSQLWLDSTSCNITNHSQRIGQLWVAELARETLLSSCGVIVQHTPLFGDEDPVTTEDYNQQSQSYSSRIDSSQSLASSIPSSPPSGAPSTEVDIAFQRLQLLAPSLRPGALGSAKTSSLLDYWPAERGIDTDDYVSSVAVASDKQFDAARQRLQRIQTRRKKQAEKYESITKAGRARRGLETHVEHEVTNSIPSGPAQIMSSQHQVPGSSQSQAFFGPQVTMSQPVAGVFGDRKKGKKGKRKSGFR